jgi:hypothetical protein
MFIAILKVVPTAQLHLETGVSVHLFGKYPHNTRPSHALGCGLGDRLCYRIINNIGRVTMKICDMSATNFVLLL